VRAGFDALLAAGTTLMIFDDDVLVPQKSHFADHLFRASVDAFPACHALARVDPYICRMDFSQFVYSCSHLIKFLTVQRYCGNGRPAIEKRREM
jgi:hypothetical protein